MDDLFYKIITKFCHDMASTLTGIELGVESMSLVDEDLELSALVKDSVHKGVLTIVFFRAFFGKKDPSWNDIESFLSHIVKKIRVENPLLLKDIPPRAALGMLYASVEGLPRGGVIACHSKGISIRGEYSRIPAPSSLICECLLRMYPDTSFTSTEIIFCENTS